MSDRRRLSPQALGSVIGAVFVIVNSASSPPVLRLVLSAGAAVALVAILVVALRSSGESTLPATAHMGRGYWLVVAGEVVALFVGLRVVAGPLDHPEAGVAWVAFVVGVHFVLLARVWQLRVFDILGAILTVLGVAGLVLAFSGADRIWIDLVSGVASGVVLLEFARRGLQHP